MGTIDLKVWTGRRCPICHHKFTPRRCQPDRSPTRDHILPKAWGGTMSWRFSDGTMVRNWRMVCANCNTLRAECGHCDGVLACLRAVLDGYTWGERPNVHRLAARWMRRLPEAASRADMQRALRKAGLITDPAPPD